MTKPKRTPPRLLKVVETRQVTPLLKRVILSGDQLKGFPADRYASHIKVFLPRPGQSEVHMPVLGSNGPVWPPADRKPIVRTYSVRYYDPDRNQLAVDFVMHGHASHASDWAGRAQVGDPLGIAGPGGPEPMIARADFHILAGDLSALPGISALLENFPSATQGEVFLEVQDKAQVHALENPAGLKINWLTQSAKYDPLLQLKAVRECRVPAGLSVSGWVAGENSSVVAVRDYLRQAYGLTKKELYAVPYWRRGNTEEEYHQDRHVIMDEEY